MPAIIWDAPGDRTYQTGVDRAVLYPLFPTNPVPHGVPWNGLISVTENASGGDAKPYFVDGIKYLNSASVEDFEATLEAYTYPDEFAVIDGTASIGKGLSIGNQPRQEFGLTYRTKIGNDLEGTDYGYKLHIIYNALAAPSDKAYGSMKDTVDPMSLSWKLTARPMMLDGYKSSAHFIVDSTQTDPYLLEALEQLLYGTGSVYPALPTPEQLTSLFANWVTLQVVDHGDGTWTASGPDPVVHFNEDDPNTFTISWHSANPISDTEYTVSSS